MRAPSGKGQKQKAPIQTIRAFAEQLIDFQYYAKAVALLRD